MSLFSMLKRWWR